MKNLFSPSDRVSFSYSTWLFFRNGNPMSKHNEESTPSQTGSPVPQPSEPVASNSSASVVDSVRISFEKVGYPQLSAVECVIEEGQIRLTGVLNSFYLKQVAQSVAMKASGIRLIDNQIEVR